MSTQMSVPAAMLESVAARKAFGFGTTLLVVGPESLLAERAVATAVSRVRGDDPAVEVTVTEAGRLDAGTLSEITGASLFATRSVVVVNDLGELPADLHDQVAALAADPGEGLALVLVHKGPPRGRSLLDKVRKLAIGTVEAIAPKPWELTQFVLDEAKQARGEVDSGAAKSLVEAVGHDLRALAAAVSQLLADSEHGQVTSADVRRYFGGRAEVTSFAVADAVLAGRTGLAMEQLRWAMATGVPPVLVTSALATGIRGLGRLLAAPGGLRDADLAKEAGVPPWKLKSMRPQARGWDQRGLGQALQTVAVADADIKGAADDAEFALERAVLAVARARRG